MTTRKKKAPMIFGSICLPIFEGVFLFKKSREKMTKSSLKSCNERKKNRVSVGLLCFIIIQSSVEVIQKFLL